VKEAAQADDVGAVIPNGGGRTSGPDYLEGLYWLGGWCTYFPFRTIDKLGGYDESYPNGYGIDIDYTYSIYKAGLKVNMINYWVDHHMMNTREHDNDPKTEEMKQASAAYFRKKWSIY
jgi:GT2 family glycosyltransferase